MKPTKALIASPFLLACVLGACASTTGRDRSESTSLSMEETRTSIDTLIKASDGGIVSLNAIATQGSADPQPAYKKYLSDLAIIETEVATVRSREAAMKANTTAFCKAWEEESGTMKNAEVKKLSAERRDSLKAAFGRVQATNAQVRKDSDPYIQTLKDLKSYFDNDLTPAGITACKPLIASATEASTVVKRDLQNMAAEIKTVQDLLASTNVAEATK
jgi:hypothetical protein